MVEGNPQKPKMWLWVSQRKPRMMIDDDVGGEYKRKVCDSRIVDEPCIEKKFPRELTDTMAGNPCILVDGTFLYGLQQT
jgi:hypothetical protein